MPDEFDNTLSRRSRRALDRPPPEGVGQCALHNDLTERLIRVECDVLVLNRFFTDMQQQSASSLASIAESHQRMSVHMEETKRQHERMDIQDEDFVTIKNETILIERAVIDLKNQTQILIDFTQGLKRFGWIVTTALLGIIVWAAQRWMEWYWFNPIILQLTDF